MIASICGCGFYGATHVKAHLLAFPCCQETLLYVVHPQCTFHTLTKIWDEELCQCSCNSPCLEVYEHSSCSNAKEKKPKLKFYIFCYCMHQVGCIHSMHLGEIHLVHAAFI